MRYFLLLALGLAAVAAVPRSQQRIIGGSETTINNYPSIASLLYTSNYVLYQQSCGGIIINARSVLTGAHCLLGDIVTRWRVRVGSTYANSGGVVHSLQNYIIHYSYYPWTRDNDIAIVRTASVITYNNAVQASRIAGSNYNLADNQIVWAAGWGRTSYQGSSSEQLRHVQIWTVNQDICVERYRSIGEYITDNMLCSGWLDVGGRDQCQGDSGLYHNGVLVGVYSWGEGCGLPRYPGVNARVSRYTTWIQANA